MTNKLPSTWTSWSTFFLPFTLRSPYSSRNLRFLSSRCPCHSSFPFPVAQEGLERDFLPIFILPSHLRIIGEGVWHNPRAFLVPAVWSDMLWDSASLYLLRNYGESKQYWRRVVHCPSPIKIFSCYKPPTRRRVHDKYYLSRPKSPRGLMWMSPPSFIIISTFSVWDFFFWANAQVLLILSLFCRRILGKAGESGMWPEGWKAISQMEAEEA